MRGIRATIARLLCVIPAACSGTDAADAGGAVVATDSGIAEADPGEDAHSTTDAPDGVVTDAETDDVADGDASPDVDATSTTDDLASNRDRLLGTYYAFLKSSVTTPQSNGLSGSNVTSVCDLWTKLAPSARLVFSTLTTRMQQARLRVDGASMLSHVVKLYRLVGGEGATATDPGSCGGGEFNRMMMSMDGVLHAALRAAHDHKGAKQSDGQYDLADTAVSSFWRDSHDLGGAHAPFDQSDETEQGAPRGQTQFFADPSSGSASAPLGRQDLATLVDPLALELDQDYDCVHASNPSCEYVTYGPACLPQAKKTGVEIFTSRYGTIDPSWMPKDCGP